MKKRLKNFLKRWGPVKFYLRRDVARFAYSIYAPKVKLFFGWLRRSNETTNFTYDLVPFNKRYLASLIAVLADQETETIEGYFAELENDESLRKHVAQSTARNRFASVSDPHVFYGRRLGWYALVRVSKPRIVIETGIDKGLGACIITRALMANAEEGQPGYYYGTDLNPEAGWLFTEPYSQFGRILYGDSVQSLRAFDQTIDFFVCDSEHTEEYEQREYETIQSKLSDRAILLSDQAHGLDVLYEFAKATGRRFVFFGEMPLNHWYPGAGIGIALPKAG